MKALLYKDACVIWGQLKILVLLVALFCLMPQLRLNGFFLIYAGIMFPTTLMSFDERSKWDTLAGMLPYADRERVLSRYVSGWAALAFGAVGLADDLARLRRHAPLGLRRPVRLGLEAAAAAAVQVLLAANHCLATGLVLPGLGYCELGVLAPIVWGLLLVGLAESARVADGADGVVCGSAFLGMLGLMGAMTILGWFPLGVLPAALAGALMALLLWNFPPAKLLPGSVGSLFLAGALGCVPLSIGWPGLSVPLGLPYWLEGGMVALQILVYQASKGRKQLFGTAPLHRWLEKRGRAPISIFYTFCVFAMLGVALAMQMAKIS